jgi:hypothetical protein
MRAVQESALRAVRTCSPFSIPAQFKPYYADWKDWAISFTFKDSL